MNTAYRTSRTLVAILGGILVLPGCDMVTVQGVIDAIGDQIDIPGDLGDILDGGGSGKVGIEEFATNTGAGTGIAVRPSDRALFMVNSTGLFGPITMGADVSTMTPFGATNLDSDAIFDTAQTAFVLAITADGEFWIGSRCCATLAIVPPEGGDAEPYTGLLEGEFESTAVKPNTLVFAPDGFDGSQISSGNLLVGQETSFSFLAAVDLDDLSARLVSNPADLNRESQHLTFGDGVLHSARSTREASVMGFQTIAPDGTPTALAGTVDAAANAFVVLDGGDLLLIGSFRGADSKVFGGVFFWSAADQALESGLELAGDERSSDEQMIRATDGTIFLSQPSLNRIVTLTDKR